MILPGNVIAEYVEQGLITIEPPLDRRQLRPCGFRVHLADAVLIGKPNQRVDLSCVHVKEPEYEEKDLQKEPLLMRPGSFALGSTVESIKTAPSLVCRVDGRSTLARLGLMVHCTATLMDSIHVEARAVVLELANVGPFELVLPRGIGIGMVSFETLAGETDLSLEQSQYKGQRGTVPPNLSFPTPKLEQGPHK
jgi:dCTP deaminase